VFDVVDDQPRVEVTESEKGELGEGAAKVAVPPRANDEVGENEPETVPL